MIFRFNPPFWSEISQSGMFDSQRLSTIMRVARQGVPTFQIPSPYFYRFHLFWRDMQLWEETFQEMKVDLNDPNTTGTSTPSPGADNSIVQAWFKPRKDVTWRLMMSSSILHHHVVMPARHWNNLFVPLRKCCAKMFDHETMQPFRLNCSLKPNPMDGRFQPPNISGFLKWGYPKSSQSDFNNFGIDTRPDLGILMDFASPPILRCLRNPHVSSLAYSSSVFAGDERMKGWPKKKTQKTCWTVPIFRNPPGTFRRTFSFTSRAGSCWEKSSWVSYFTLSNLRKLLENQGIFNTQKIWSFHGIQPQKNLWIDGDLPSVSHSEMIYMVWPEFLNSLLKANEWCETEPQTPSLPSLWSHSKKKNDAKFEMTDGVPWVLPYSLLSIRSTKASKLRKWPENFTSKKYLSSNPYSSFHSWLSRQDVWCVKYIYPLVI